MMRNGGAQGEGLAQLYLAIISRYKDYIEEREELSVADLPTLVQPNGALVAKKAGEIRALFPHYSYDRDFLGAAEKAFEFVKGQVEDVVLPIQFWLTPEETLDFMMGDQMDKNILLCSLLISIGNPTATVLVVKSESARSVYTYFEFGGRIHLAGMPDGTKEYASISEMIRALAMPAGATAYSFNNQSYSDIC